MSKILGWHFLKDDRRLNYGSGREVRAGQTIIVHQRKKELDLCTWGLHASEKILDALSYAPGPVICRVELSGEIIRGDDKLVATRRKCIAMADATIVLHEFACWCAENALSLIDNPDPRSIAAVQAKHKWLRGEIMDDELAAAWAAAWAAAMDAARASATAATIDAARGAAWAAAMDAARDAVIDAARSAARDAQEKELSRRMHELLSTNE